MGDKSSIEWTDATWNPVVGCSRVSAGCKNCYAERVAHRGMAKQHRGLTVMGPKGPRWTGEARFVPSALDKPLRWKKPRRVFVNSMSDLFHEGLTNEQIAAVFGVMAASPQHTFQVLTKRPERMVAWFRWAAERANAARRCAALAVLHLSLNGEPTGRLRHRTGDWSISGVDTAWPLPNVWLGVSVEDQATADERIPLLLEVSAAVRWVSYEPALGPVDFARFLPRAECCEDRDRGVEGVCGWEGGLAAAYDAHPMEHITGCPLCGSTAINEIPEGLSWVVVGGESGPGARPFNVEWARSVIRQGRDAGVPVFVKQLGAQPFDLEPVFKSWGLGMELRDRKGGDWSEWPEDLRVREMPEVTRG